MIQCSGNVGVNVGELGALANRAAHTQTDGCCQGCKCNGEVVIVNHGC